MKQLLIVYHSYTGGTRQMARAAAQGATRETTVIVTLVTAGEVDVESMLKADAYLFACPENLPAISGQMKDFFDRTYYPVLNQIQGRPYAILIARAATGPMQSVKSSGSRPGGD